MRILILGFRKGYKDFFKNKDVEVFYIVSKEKHDLINEKYCLINNLEDAQEVLRAVKYLGIDHIDNVLTGHEDAIFSASIIRSYFNIESSYDFSFSLNFRDKFLQKNFLSKSINKANIRYVNNKTSFECIKENISLPFIIKPSNGMGSKNTKKINNELEFNSFKSIIKTDIGYVVESFINGNEFCIDGIILDGKIKWYSVSKYSTPVMSTDEHNIASGQIILRNNNIELFSKIDKLLYEVFKNNKLTSIFHLEFFYDSNQNVYFSECALRIGGALIPEIIFSTFGINLYEQDFNINVLNKFIFKEKEVDYIYGFIFLKKPKNKLILKKDILEHFNVHEIDYPENEDDLFNINIRSYNRIGHVILKNKTECGLNDDINRLIKYFI